LVLFFCKIATASNTAISLEKVLTGPFSCILGDRSKGLISSWSCKVQGSHDRGNNEDNISLLDVLSRLDNNIFSFEITPTKFIKDISIISPNHIVPNNTETVKYSSGFKEYVGLEKPMKQDSIMIVSSQILYV
jgi:hypothetical protein